MSRFADMGGNRPLEIDLTEAIQSSIDGALGKPRPVETIKADMATLEAELKLAQEEEENQKTASPSSSSRVEGGKQERGKMAEVVEEDLVEDRNTMSLPLMCCGVGV
jgi:hypothetical protein